MNDIDPSSIGHDAFDNDPQAELGGLAPPPGTETEREINELMLAGKVGEALKLKNSGVKVAEVAKEPKLPLDSNGFIIVEELAGGDYLPGWGHVIKVPSTDIADAAFDSDKHYGPARTYKYEREYATRLNEFWRLRNDGADETDIMRAQNKLSRLISLAMENGVTVPVRSPKKK